MRAMTAPLASPLDDTRQLAQSLPGGDGEGAARFAETLGGADRLVRLAVWLRRWREKRAMAVSRPNLVLFAGAHGVARRGVSPVLPQATADEVAALGAGQAPLGRLCAGLDLGLRVFDLALEHPTGDIAETTALDERGCAATIAFGMEAVAGSPDLLVLGAVSAPGAEVSSAVLHALLGGEGGAEWLALDDAAGHIRLRAEQAVGEALARHREADPLKALAAVGGRETAALVGAILAARAEHVPVLLDGAAAFAAAAVAARLSEGAVAHCILAQGFGDAKRAALSERLGLDPLLPAGFARPGEAGASAVGLVRAAAALGGQGA